MRRVAMVLLSIAAAVLSAYKAVAGDALAADKDKRFCAASGYVVPRPPDRERHHPCGCALHPRRRGQGRLRKSELLTSLAFYLSCL